MTFAARSFSIRMMEIARDIADARKIVRAARSEGRRITFVPTMGALHLAHVSLMHAAKGGDSFLVVSIFVNPTQFGPNEDFEEYPRDEAHDLTACEQAGVDLVFLPSTDAMYPSDSATTVRVDKLTDTLCGARRPGHFDGVATVVTKLFNIIQPDAAYFGRKDAQQLAVISRMTRDLDMPIEIVGCPTVREEDGLAVSSRNAYLNQQERRQATCLYRSLNKAMNMIESERTDADAIIDAMRRIIDEAGPATVDYISIVDPASMQPVKRIDRGVLVALAVRIGPTRLIDNIEVDPRPVSR